MYKRLINAHCDVKNDTYIKCYFQKTLHCNCSNILYIFCMIKSNAILSTELEFPLVKYVNRLAESCNA